MESRPTIGRFACSSWTSTKLPKPDLGDGDDQEAALCAQLPPQRPRPRPRDPRRLKRARRALLRLALRARLHNARRDPSQVVHIVLRLSHLEVEQGVLKRG